MAGVRVDITGPDPETGFECRFKNAGNECLAATNGLLDEAEQPFDCASSLGRCVVDVLRNTEGSSVGERETAQMVVREVTGRDPFEDRPISDLLGEIGIDG